MMINPNSTNQCWFIIHKDESVLINHDNTFPNTSEIIEIEYLFIRNFDLDSKYCCAELNETAPIPHKFKTVTLRHALSLMNEDQYMILVKAYSVIRWDKNHQFCGRCGTKTIHQSKHFERTCNNCAMSFFPRISPSIIVLIYQDDHLIMARSPHFPPGVYAFIAGFVEIGETIEEAVQREVHEEVGLKVKNISYFGSQPWPFPDSLMLAFTAEYDTGELNVDNNELEDAGWYRYDNLPGMPSMKISIAFQLLENFIQLCRSKYET